MPLPYEQVNNLRNELLQHGTDSSLLHLSKTKAKHTRDAKKIGKPPCSIYMASKDKQTKKGQVRTILHRSKSWAALPIKLFFLSSDKIPSPIQKIFSFSHQPSTKQA